ncbi:hypothetical protein Pcinc_038531 [Petrolisthes cinctipes]|uniref:Carboxylesterase type B domain-containing protein n=1 Tax=Petrolisthes cinctipes TaxID=88211 RepID=A0AAE1BQG9_PETCI|nr:hypothetical protein Pcinc_038531 [Petrolisthes cinctipes]
MILKESLPGPSIKHWLGGEVAVNEAASDNITKLMTDYSFGVPKDNTPSTHFMKPIDVGKHWVTHSDDLLYLFPGGVFHNDIPLKDPRDLRVREIMTKMWVNFVATGNPPRPTSPLGSSGEAVTRGRLLATPSSYNLTPVMMSDQRAEARDFLASLLPNIDYLQD